MQTSQERPNNLPSMWPSPHSAKSPSERWRCKPWHNETSVKNTARRDKPTVFSSSLLKLAGSRKDCSPAVPEAATLKNFTQCAKYTNNVQTASYRVGCWRSIHSAAPSTPSTTDSHHCVVPDYISWTWSREKHWGLNSINCDLCLWMEGAAVWELKLQEEKTGSKRRFMCMTSSISNLCLKVGKRCRKSTNYHCFFLNLWSALVFRLKS